MLFLLRAALLRPGLKRKDLTVRTIRSHFEKKKNLCVSLHHATEAAMTHHHAYIEDNQER